MMSQGVIKEEREGKGFLWPHGYRSAAIFTYDIDASCWEYLSAKNVSGNFSVGDYGPRAGVPRILDFLDRHGIKATFFVPGWVAERFPDRIKEIHNRGQEVGAHGYLHENLSKITEEEEREIWKKVYKILTDITGAPPRLYRTTGEQTIKGIRIISELRGRLVESYTGSYFPCKIKLEGSDWEMLRLPFSWILDDFPFVWGGILPGGAGVAPGFLPICSPGEALEYYMAEFDSIHAVGGLFQLCNHPRAIGRASRIRAMDKLIRHIKATPGVWLASPGEVVDWVLKSKDVECFVVKA
jgi:peptidoglycan/xylan/chitin deacetylase (PgdA/CDA1 family)